MKKDEDSGKRERRRGRKMKTVERRKGKEEER